jgi:hypothetical protein
MNTTKRLIAGLVDYLQEMSPDETIAIVDAKRREDVALPTIAVDVTSAEPHSVSLSNVMRSDVEITLRSHAGDETADTIDDWADTIETLLNDPAGVRLVCDDGIRIDHWLYRGSEEEWDENIVEVKFSAECLVTRI